MLVRGCRFKENVDARPSVCSDRHRHPGARLTGALRTAAPRGGGEGDHGHLRRLRQAGKERQSHPRDHRRPRLLRLQPGVPRETEKEEETVATTRHTTKRLIPVRNPVFKIEPRGMAQTMPNPRRWVSSVQTL